MSYPCKIKIELTDVDNIKTVVSKTFNSYTPAGELETIGEFFNQAMFAAGFDFFNKDTILPYSLSKTEHFNLLERLTIIRKEAEFIKDAHLIEISPMNTNEQVSIKFYYKNEKNEIEYETSDIIKFNVIQTFFNLFNNFIRFTELDSDHKNNFILTESLTYNEAKSLKNYLHQIRNGKI